MAATERSVTRREPIVTTVDDKLVFEASPLRWRKRNDLSNAVQQSYASVLTDMIAAGKPAEDGSVQLRGGSMEDSLDYPGFYAIGYPDGKPEDMDALDFDQMIEVLGAALEVNGLERLVWMLDPERKKAPAIGANEASIAETTPDGPKTE